jgi:hypothetical protein
MNVAGGRSRSWRAGSILILVVLSAMLPAQRAGAALVRTEAVLQEGRAHELREAWVAAVQRAEVREALHAQGVSPKEAQARVLSLSDSEILDIAERMDELPAGQGVGEVLVAVVLVFAVLVVLDVAGVTDVFPWIEKRP